MHPLVEENTRLMNFSLTLSLFLFSFCFLNSSTIHYHFLLLSLPFSLPTSLSLLPPSLSFHITFIFSLSFSLPPTLSHFCLCLSVFLSLSPSLPPSPSPPPFSPPFLLFPTCTTAVTLTCATLAYLCPARMRCRAYFLAMDGWTLRKAWAACSTQTALRRSASYMGHINKTMCALRIVNLLETTYTLICLLPRM